MTNACHSVVEVLYYFYLGIVEDFFFSNQAEKWKWLDEGRGELRLDDPRIRIAYYFENGKREKKNTKSWLTDQ